MKKSNFQKFQILPRGPVLLLSLLLDCVFSVKNWHDMKSLTYRQVFFIFD